MIGAVGLFSIAAGAVVAYLSTRFPAQIAALETCAGALLIGGLALTGCALPAMI